MTQRLILHIGHPKTGTTTLQKTLQASRASLADAGILHPNTGSHHNHKVLLPYLTSTQDNLDSNSTKVANSQKQWGNVIKEVTTSKPNTVILSSEGFFSGMDVNAFNNFCSHVKSLASETVVAAYLREPASLALSRAQQNIKRSPNFTLRPKDYYRSSLEKFKNSGLGSMNVRVFDRKKLEEGDLVDDFFAQHFQDFDTELLTRSKDDNTSFSAEAMALIQEVQRQERSFPIGKARYLIEKADRELQGFARPRMHDHVRHAIQARCSDLDWLKDEFDLEFSKIDTTVMPNSEANRVCDALDKVEDMCIVDKDRKEALWNAACKGTKTSQLRRLFSKILNKG